MSRQPARIHDQTIMHDPTQTHLSKSDRRRPAVRAIAMACAAATCVLCFSPAAEAVVVEAEFQVPAEAFDQWVFQQVGSSRVARIHLGDLLAARIAAVDAACRLTAQQQRKLTLAGKIDIRRLFERIEAIRDEFLAVRLDQQQFNKANIWQRTSPLQTSIMGGVFGPGSLYQKVLANTLNADQQTRWDNVQAVRRRYAYEAKIRLTLVALEPALPLTADQREGLVALLLSQTPPPLREGANEQHCVLYQCGRLEVRAVARLLTLPQLRILRERVQSFPEAQRTFLVQQGLLPDEQRPSSAVDAQTLLGEADDQALEQAVQQVATEETLP